MPTSQEAFTSLVVTLRQLGPILGAASAIQHESPPMGARSSDTEGRGVKRPTEDIVLDPRRVRVSDGVSATVTALRQADAALAQLIEPLRAAVDRWEGKDGPP